MRRAILRESGRLPRTTGRCVGRSARHCATFDGGDDARQLVGVDAIHRVAEPEAVPKLASMGVLRTRGRRRDDHRLGLETGRVQGDTHPAGRFAHAELGREVSDDVPPFSGSRARAQRVLVVRSTTQHRDLALDLSCRAVVVEPLPIPRRVSATEIGKGHREVGARLPELDVPARDRKVGRAGERSREPLSNASATVGSEGARRRRARRTPRRRAQCGTRRARSA